MDTIKYKGHTVALIKIKDNGSYLNVSNYMYLPISHTYYIIALCSHTIFL